VEHTPLRNDADPLWREMHAAADRERTHLVLLLRAAFAALAAGGTGRRLRSALMLGDVEAALRAVPYATLLTLAPALEDVLRRVALTGAEIEQAAALVLRLGDPSGLPVAEIAAWARQRGASLVAGITEQTRRGLRQAIVAAIDAGRSPVRAAEEIVAAVGLNTVQVTALLNRADELRTAGATEARIQAALARYAAQLQRQRARVIARHELMQAASEGRRAVWERDVRNGLIAPDRWEREWVAIVPSDGRTCPYCEELDGQTAPINGTYPNGDDGPPGHVLCRCTEVLRRVA